MKSIPIFSKADLENVTQYEGVADWLLFDAPPFTPPASGGDSGGVPGGNGIAFDWNILKDYKSTTPWMLAGGLNADNVGEALTICAPDALDVSSGVEVSKGVKDSDKIRSFISAVKSA